MAQLVSVPGWGSDYSFYKNKAKGEEGRFP
jgi:hypothetical protein